MRDVTRHCTIVFPILPDIMSRERLGTHSQGATSRLVFPLYDQRLGTISFFLFEEKERTKLINREAPTTARNLR